MLEANYRLVGNYLDQASRIILGLIVLTYLWRLVTGGRLGARVRAWAHALRRDVHAIYLASRDERVPWYAKGLALLIAAYAVSPVDLIPDFIPVLGHLDDVILVPLGVILACQFPALAEHRRRAEAGAGQPSDWRVGAVFIGIQGIALAFLVRWSFEFFGG